MNTFPHSLGHFCSGPAVKNHTTKGCLNVSLIKGLCTPWMYQGDTEGDCMPGCREQVGRGVVSGVLWCAGQGGTPGVGTGVVRGAASASGWAHFNFGWCERWGGMWDSGGAGGTGNLSPLELSHYVYISCPWQPNSVLYLGLVLCRSFLPFSHWWQNSDKTQNPEWFLVSLPEQVDFCLYFFLRCSGFLSPPRRVCCPSLQRFKAFAS